MQITTKGLVLHHFKYSEKSIIAKIYTEQCGLQSYIINGVRTSKSINKAAYLQPLSLVELTATQKPNRNLHLIKTIQLYYPYSSIPFDIIKSSIAFFLAEILYKTIKEEETNVSLYHFLENAFKLLDLNHESCANFHLIFLGKFLHHLGIYPNQENTAFIYFDLQEGSFVSNQPRHNAFISPPTSALLKKILNASLSKTDLMLSKTNRANLLSIFLDYFKLHLSNFDNLKSLVILKEVLN